MIKNLGGTIVPTGGYIAGRYDLVEKISNDNGISTNCLGALKYNYEILEKCDDEKFILEKIKQYQEKDLVLSLIHI